MFKLSQIAIRSSKFNNGLRPLLRSSSLFSQSVVEVKKATQIAEEEPRKPASSGRGPNNIVAAAFASLHSEDPTNGIKTPFTDERIGKAKNVDQLLSISEGTGVSRRHALKVVSMLAEWSSKGQVELAEFENDPRFIRLCKILTKTNHKKVQNNNSIRNDDLTTILSVTADDEAAKLVANITLAQMVKVMSTLSIKRRRSTLLLRALAYNITASNERLNIKQSADLLFSMSTLNFPDDNLLAKVSQDVCEELHKETKRSAVVGSVVTSLGLMKYKNLELLDAISDWMLKNHAICRPQDTFSFFMTLAVVNYFPSNVEKLFATLVPQLTQAEAGKPVVWLEIVWSLVLLNQAKSSHVSSVLEEDFVQKLGVLNVSTQLKLLNIDAAAQYLIADYQGARIPANSSLRSVELGRSKEKQDMVESVVDSMKNLIQSPDCLQYNFNTGLGFYVDAVCWMDHKLNPLPFTSKNNATGTKIALLTLDYHDMCRGRIQPSGVNVLAKTLLEAQKYRVLFVPFNEFKPREKIVTRVQYLETKLKEVLKQS